MSSHRVGAPTGRWPGRRRRRASSTPSSDRRAEHPQLHRREVLRLVDHDVAVGADRRPGRRRRWCGGGRGGGPSSARASSSSATSASVHATSLERLRRRCAGARPLVGVEDAVTPPSSMSGAAPNRSRSSCSGVSTGHMRSSASATSGRRRSSVRPGRRHRVRRRSVRSSLVLVEPGAAPPAGCARWRGRGCRRGWRASRRSTSRRRLLWVPPRRLAWRRCRADARGEHADGRRR